MNVEYDYTRKLMHPSVVRDVVSGVRVRTTPQSGSLADMLGPNHERVSGPISINLDLTVACNYECDHCIDLHILNSGHRHRRDDITRSLSVLRLAGLRSVILIGGGEPTLHPAFREVAVAIKLLGLQCAIVSNGSAMERIGAVASHFKRGDWVRLSLDAGCDETFQAMHRPRKKVTLESICSSAAAVKRTNPDLTLGFSFIVSWSGASVNGRAIRENIDEIAKAAALARDHRFDFIAFKPLLERDVNGAETILLDDSQRQRVSLRVGEELDAAQALQTADFRVLRSNNLREVGAAADPRLKIQPRRCHMRLFRQVLTPTGLYGCPVYRGAARDQMGSATAYDSAEAFLVTRRRTLAVLNEFDASAECRAVTCLYNSANWWLESVREGLEPPSTMSTSGEDFFL